MEYEKIQELAKKAFKIIQKREYHIHAWPVDYNPSTKEVYDYINALYSEMHNVSLGELENLVCCLQEPLAKEEGDIDKQLHTILWCTMMDFFDIDIGNSQVLQIGNHENMQSVLFEIFILDRIN